jgi:hypothetical protein
VVTILRSDLYASRTAADGFAIVHSVGTYVQYMSPSSFRQIMNPRPPEESDGTRSAKLTASDVPGRS